MVDKTYPSARMLQEDVRPLLARLTLLVMENVFRFERLIDGQIDRIVGIGNTSGSIGRSVDGHRVHLLVDDIFGLDHVARPVIPGAVEQLFPLERRRHPLVMRRLAEPVMAS